MILDLDAPVNQSHVGMAIGKSQQAVSKLATKIGISESTTNADLLISIFERLTEEAAGRGGKEQHQLTSSRIRETNANAELKELLVKEKSGELVNVTEIEPQLIAMITAAKQELLYTLANKIVSGAKATEGIDLDTSWIQELINDALKHLAASLHGNDAGDDVEGDEDLAPVA